jgi:hypothetical protein
MVSGTHVKRSTPCPATFVDWPPPAACSNDQCCYCNKVSALKPG